MEYLITQTIETLVRERHNALTTKDQSMANQIQDDLEIINVKVTDLREGTKWRFFKNQSQQNHRPQI